MIFNMTGGGAALNFKIVNGLEQPSNPSENTIWLKTEDEISNYSFNFTEPSNQTEGMAWITLTNNTSNVSINALKKNEILLYLSYCYQYISSERNQLDAYIYQNGQWVQFSSTWDNYYFKNGDQYKNITGGWSSEGYTYSTPYTLYDGIINDTDGTLEIELSNNYSASVIGTVDTVDLTNVSNLHIVVDYASSGTSIFAVLSSKDLSSNENIIRSTSLVNFNNATRTIDVSDLSGQYYLAVYGAVTQTSGSVDVSISQIYKD